MKIMAAPATTTATNLASETHPPKPYDII
jgi:hypothetical protein